MWYLESFLMVCGVAFGLVIAVICVMGLAFAAIGEDPFELFKWLFRTTK